MDDNKDASDYLARAQSLLSRVKTVLQGLKRKAELSSFEEQTVEDAIADATELMEIIRSREKGSSPPGSELRNLISGSIARIIDFLIGKT